MKEVELIINKYVEAIINYQMTLDSDYKKANKYFSQAEKCLCELKLIENWIEHFRCLLEHENISVKINAATALLPYETKRAKVCLKRCCLLPGMKGFEARMVLREWKSGDLKFPIYKNGEIVYVKYDD